MRNLFKKYFIVIYFLMFLISGCISLSYNKKFIKQNPDLSIEKKEAILKRKVIIGMFPDEAHAAAGAFTYLTKYNANYKGDRNQYPPNVIFSQKENPDPNIRIIMVFKNRTQFNSKDSIAFVVLFLNGKACKIEEVGENNIKDLLIGSN